MGCKLVRGETVYFVSQCGPTTLGIETEWYRDDVIDNRLLPSIYTRSEEDSPRFGFPSVIPIEIRTFEVS
jgi:hypothetical protein